MFSMSICHNSEKRIVFIRLFCMTRKLVCRFNWLEELRKLCPTTTTIVQFYSGKEQCTSGIVRLGSVCLEPQQRRQCAKQSCLCSLWRSLPTSDKWNLQQRAEDEKELSNLGGQLGGQDASDDGAWGWIFFAWIGILIKSVIEIYMSFMFLFCLFFDLIPEETASLRP